MQKVLKTYLRRLINLSSANRSLLLMNLPKSQFLDIHELDFVLNMPSFEVVNQLIAQKKQIPLCEVIDPRDVRNNEISKQVSQISRTEQTIQEERGVQDLFVGYPFVKGKFLDGTSVRCPLVFFPVSLKKGVLKGQQSPVWFLEPRDADITLNRSFLTAYSHFNSQGLSDELFDFSLEDFPENSVEFRTALYEFLKDSPLKINFNQDLFTDKLTLFEKLLKADIETVEKNGELKLFPQAVLGIFPQGGSFLIEDYENMLRNETFDNEEGFESLFPAPEEFVSGHSIREEELLLPFEVDASQEDAIKTIKTGQSLLIQGPPGTGKSQLICNLISDYIAKGKKVLVVCQKRAALDTVYKRLDKAGITDFIGLVHDYKNDRKSIFDKISSQIDKTEVYKKQNQSLDAIFLEREFDQTCRRIDQITKELGQFKTALFDESYAGKSIKELYLLQDRDAVLIDLTGIYRDFNFVELNDFERDLNRIQSYKKILENGTPEADFWKLRKSARHWTPSDQKKITGLLKTSMDTWKKTASELEEALGKSLTVNDLMGILPEVLDEIAGLLHEEDHLALFGKLDSGEVRLLKKNQRAEIEESLHKIATSGGINPVFFEDQKNISVAIDEALDKSKGFISRSIFKTFSDNKTLVNKLLTDEGLSFTTENILLLRDKFNNTVLFQSLSKEIALAGLDLPDDFKAAQAVWAAYEKASQAFELLRESVPVLSGTLYTKIPDLGSFTYLNRLLKDHFDLIGLTISNLKEYMAEEQIEIFWTSDVQAINQYFNGNFDYLVELDQLTGSLTTTETKVLELLEKADLKPGTSYFETFRQSLIHSWVEYIEEIHPILRGTSTLKISSSEEELKTSVQKKQGLSRDILALKIKEFTYKDLEKNRLGNTITFRELYHQTTKKRKIWPLRKLLAEYPDEVFKLLPCWLVSPETTSAIFPLPENDDSYSKFDLVIFDEASQCFSESGIPALMRARQAVIVGDNKQLQPSDLYKIRFEDQETEEPLLEIDSLLDLGSQFLPQKQLTGHYRSKNLELIDFSNRHFYKSKLRLLPDFKDINQAAPPIKFIKIDGIWEDNTNPVEALAVVELIRELKMSNPKEEIGVVAFNFKQAELIFRMLEAEGLNSPDIHVKNIENIQGDEFQTLIFSIAYAPDKSGKLVMNFGSLNQKGGENRLNVAITRAKEKIFVISSIFPEQLNVESSSNEGPKLLKKYLEYVRIVSDNEFLPTFQPSEKSFAISLKQLIMDKYAGQTGPEYLEELPFADITLKESDRYRSLLLTDDTLFYDSLSPKEFFAYMPLLLKQKGWSFERRWSRRFNA